MNSFSGRNAHHVATSTGIPIATRIPFFRDTHEPVFVFIVFSPKNQTGQALLPGLFLFDSLELLQRRGAEVRVEALAVDGNRPEFRQVRSRRDLVILVAFIAL